MEVPEDIPAAAETSFLAISENTFVVVVAVATDSSLDCSLEASQSILRLAHNLQLFVFCMIVNHVRSADILYKQNFLYCRSQLES